MAIFPFTILFAVIVFAVIIWAGFSTAKAMNGGAKEGAIGGAITAIITGFIGRTLIIIIYGITQASAYGEQASFIFFGIFFLLVIPWLRGFFH